MQRPSIVLPACLLKKACSAPVAIQRSRQKSCHDTVREYRARRILGQDELSPWAGRFQSLAATTERIRRIFCYQAGRAAKTAGEGPRYGLKPANRNGRKLWISAEYENQQYRSDRSNRQNQPLRNNWSKVQSRPATISSTADSVFHTVGFCS